MPQQPVGLPPILTETARADGFRSPMWVTRKLLPGEKMIVERTLAELANRDVPAPINKIRFYIGKTLNHWENNRLGAAEKDLIIADYEFALRDFSEGQIAEACAQWVSESRFKPVPADIVTLVRNNQYRDRESARRARVLLGLEEPRNWERPLPPLEPTKPYDAKGLLASLADRLKTSAAKKASPAQSRADILASRDPDAVQKLAALRKTEEKAVS